MTYSEIWERMEKLSPLSRAKRAIHNNPDIINSHLNYLGIQYKY